MTYKIFVANNTTIYFSRFLYPKAEESNLLDVSDDRVQRGEPDGKYELHAQIDNAIKEEIKQLMLDGIITTCLNLYFCCIWRIFKA